MDDPADHPAVVDPRDPAHLVDRPSLQSVIAGHVPSNQQGELQGALTSLMSVTTIIGPLIMNGSFAYFTSDKAPFHFPGIHFLLGAVFMLISLYVIYRVLSRERREKPEMASVLEGAHVEEKH